MIYFRRTKNNFSHVLFALYVEWLSWFPRKRKGTILSILHASESCDQSVLLVPSFAFVFKQRAWEGYIVAN